MTYQFRDKLLEIQNLDGDENRIILFDFIYSFDEARQHDILDTLLHTDFDAGFLSECLNSIITSHNPAINEIILNSLGELNQQGKILTRRLPGLLYILSLTMGKQRVLDTYSQFQIADTELDSRMSYFFHD